MHLYRKDVISGKMNNYTAFTFEDFLQDDFFILSVIEPSKESKLFWKAYQQGHPENLSVYTEAVRCIQDFNEDVLDEEKVNRIWSYIQKNLRRKRAAKIRRLYVAGAAVAASIALLFFFRHHPTEEIEQDIRSFAQINMPIEESTETQLIVSDDRTLALADNESIISYDSASLKVTSRETVREEIATAEMAEFNQLIIPKGKRSYLTLSDGTQIWANSGTRLVYPATFKTDKREIFVDGEIFLHVQPDETRPFIVQTHDMNVQVLGTEFNVQAYGADKLKRVVLKSGSVRISAETSKESVVLQPSEMYEAVGDREIVQHVNVNNYISWINGLYICDNERLEFILARLSRYYGIEIKADKKAAALECFGKLDMKDNLHDVMRVIKFIVPVEYTYENNTYSVTYKH